MSWTHTDQQDRVKWKSRVLQIRGKAENLLLMNYGEGAKSRVFSYLIIVIHREKEKAS